MMYEKCTEIREMLVGFLDDELPCDVSHGIQEHLDRCAPCARLAKVEQGFTGALRTRVRRIEPPPEFAARIRRRLKDPESLAGGATVGASPRRRFLPGLWSAGYALAATLLVAAVLAPAVEFVYPGSFGRLVDSLTGVRDAGGVLVCLECEKMGVPVDHQRHCRNAAHHTGLKCPETGLWNLVVNDAALPLLSDPEKRGAQVIVHGRFLKDIRYIDARSITIAPGT